MKKTIILIITVVSAISSVMAADKHFIGSVDSQWLTAANWDSGLPAAADNPWIDMTADAIVSSTGATGFICRVDNGRTLTIATGGTLSLTSSSISALRLGDAGDANLIIDGGTLSHPFKYGGDFKCGSGSGTVNVTMNSGTWNTRTISLGEAIVSSGDLSQWGDVNGTVQSTINFLQEGGNIDLETGLTVGRGLLYVGYSSGANVTYTMNDGTLKLTNIRLCFCGTTGTPTYGTFNLNNGTVTVKDVKVGYKGSGVTNGGTTNSPGSIGQIVQTAGTMNASGSLWIGEGNKQGVYSISGGTLAVTTNLINGLDGTGTFEIIGAAPVINAKTYTQNAKSKLRAVITSGGIAKINVSTTANIAAGALFDINVEEGVTLADAQTFTLMTAAGGITLGSANVIGNSCGHFTLAVSGNNLVLTYHEQSDIARCYVLCENRPEYDFDNDCIVNIGDLTAMLTEWLDSFMY
jgi:hypothetical protein